MFPETETEETPDKFGYMTLKSNRPVTSDAVFFNRSASSSAEVRARQLGNIQRQTQSLPVGMVYITTSEK